MSKYISYLFLSVCVMLHTYAQQKDEVVIQRLFSNALQSNQSYKLLGKLCDSAGGRMVGTQKSRTAIHLFQSALQKIQIDTVFLQEYYAPAWYCHSREEATVKSSVYGMVTLAVEALGPSVSTGEQGLNAQVIEVKQLSDLDSLGSEKVKGKIVFFNRPMDEALYNPSYAYRGAYDQRVDGADKASAHGAAGVIVRSLTMKQDEMPHTGLVRYTNKVEKIPAVAISTQSANKLSNMLLSDPELLLNIKVNSEYVDSVKTCNVIGEIKGTSKPDEIILIGAHTDAWYNTPGAHDDGAGCVQVIDVLRMFRELNIKTSRTIRVVLYMDEEMNQSGARYYAKCTGQTGEKHLAAIESDYGGFIPIGFSIDANDTAVAHISEFKYLLEPYGLYKFDKGFAGVDIGMLKPYKVPLIGVMTSNQKYFDYHHSANDTFDAVHIRELQLGTAAIASLVYLIDAYGTGQ